MVKIISRIEGGESSDWMNGELNNVNLTEFFLKTSPGTYFQKIYKIPSFSNVFLSSHNKHILPRPEKVCLFWQVEDVLIMSGDRIVS